MCYILLVRLIFQNFKMSNLKKYDNYFKCQKPKIIPNPKN